jgi:hypothetical protein
MSGIALELLTALLAALGPSGPGWSLRGNGALIVPLAVAPGLLAAAWTALVLHSHGREWTLPAAGLVALALLLALLDLAAISLTGRELVLLVGGFPVYLFWLLPVAAPLAAWLFARGSSGRGVAIHAAAGASYLLLLVVALQGTAVLIPPH